MGSRFAYNGYLVVERGNKSSKTAFIRVIESGMLKLKIPVFSQSGIVVIYVMN